MSHTKNPYAGPFDELSFHLGRAYYDHVRLTEVLLEETGLSEHLAPGMGQILFNLFETDDVIIKDLTRKLRCSPSHLTAVLRKMEKAGVIIRRKDKTDGRAVRIRLTKFGKSLRQRCKDMLIEMNRRLCEGMSADEIITMKKHLELMVQNVKKYRS